MPAAHAPVAATPHMRLTLVLIVLVDLLGLGIIIPLLPTYAKRLEASGLELGLLLGVYSLMQFIFNPILGRWSDRIGRRPVLILTQVGSAAGYAVLALGDVTNSLALLFAGRILDGITGANVATAQAAMSDITAPADRARGMGLLGAAFGVGFVLGPALMAVSSAPYTWLPAVLAGALALLAALLVYLYLPETRPPSAVQPDPSADAPRPVHGFVASLRHCLAVAPLRDLLLVYALAVLAFSGLHATFVPLLQDRFAYTPQQTGWVFVYIGAIIVLVQGALVGRLSRRLGEFDCVRLGLVLLIAGFFLVPLTATLAALLGAVALYAVGNGLINPCLTSLISRRSTAAQRGQVLGVASGLASLCAAVGQPLGGQLYDLVEWWPNRIGDQVYHALPFWFSVAVYGAALAVLVAVRRRHRALPPEPLEPAAGPPTAAARAGPG